MMIVVQLLVCLIKQWNEVNQ